MDAVESEFDWKKFADDIIKQREIDIKELSLEEFQRKYFGIWESKE